MEDTDMSYLEIEKVTGRQIIDSRGNPTVEAEVVLKDGIRRSSEGKAFRRQLPISMRKLRLY